MSDCRYTERMNGMEEEKKMREKRKNFLPDDGTKMEMQQINLIYKWMPCAQYMDRPAVGRSVGRRVELFGNAFARIIIIILNITHIQDGWTTTHHHVTVELRSNAASIHSMGKKIVLYLRAHNHSHPMAHPNFESLSTHCAYRICVISIIRFNKSVWGWMRTARGVPLKFHKWKLFTCFSVRFHPDKWQFLLSSRGRGGGWSISGGEV